MADIIDLGNEAADTFLRAALSTRKPTGPEYNGHCYNCGDKVPYPRRWCDADCRDDWQSRGSRIEVDAEDTE